jgi:hypothetical protein
MADQQFTQANIDAAQEILSDLKAKAKAAHDANDVFTFGILNDLIKSVSPIVTKAFMRVQRVENARINAAHKELRAKFRESGPTTSDL